jgi:hypothetical protein
MNPLLLKINLCLLISLLFYLGGQIHHNIRRIPIPLILALYFAITLKWWLFFPIGLGYWATIILGYGSPEGDDKPSFLGKVFRVGWLIRGIWGLLVASLGSLALVWGGFIPLIAYLGYIALNFGIGAYLCYKEYPVNVIEPLVGLGIGAVLFL